VVGNGLKQVEIIFARGPGSEGNESWLQREAGVATEFECAEEVAAGVALFQFEEDFVIERFDCAGDEQATGACESWQSIRVTEQMLDFYRYVVGEIRMSSVKSLHDARGMGDAVEKIWIAEGNVLRACFDLLTNVGENNIERDNVKLSSINRNDGAMTAEMFAAARRFGVPRGAVRAVWQNDVSVFFSERVARRDPEFRMEDAADVGRRTRSRL